MSELPSSAVVPDRDAKFAGPELRGPADRTQKPRASGAKHR
jgi:hypothetical protein